MRCRFALLLLPVLAACQVGRTVEELETRSPGKGSARPDWIVVPATGAAWITGAAGWLGSIVFLPITYPLSLAAEDPLGVSREEFLFWGVPACATCGHVIIGTPLDVLDFSFRRAWMLGPEVEIVDERVPIEDITRDRPAAESVPSPDPGDTSAGG